MIRFNRNEHVFHSPDFEEIIKDTIRFFNGTPVLPLPIPERFSGTGVYAIYCTARSGIYKEFHEINRISYVVPIYIGKAVPKGWRQARTYSSDRADSYELNNRIREHGRNLEAVDGIEPEDFRCRFMILEGTESDLIGTVEAALIRSYKPLWNTLIDGFGNHDPGSGRYEQAMSDWDVCHPGRSWADKCRGKHSERKLLLDNITEFMTILKETYGSN
ncbi:MAG: Eco29kI family restriction endonuclease [Candidatus Electrothrix aestuarii]|uniref:Eco29kI family restriction endonuclease n=1 Tax=Candidatus Electrothrix aestuarii TaxID=3062594 RepID=A0AAU8LTY7_9BACT|nr:Eco29kI family restriction endonuclease [Candidatus Electrothrix aestuarii]